VVATGRKRSTELSEQEVVESLDISDPEFINVRPPPSLCHFHACGLTFA
jgi:hypothetical protein